MAAIPAKRSDQTNWPRAVVRRVHLHPVIPLSHIEEALGTSGELFGPERPEREAQNGLFDYWSCSHPLHQMAARD